MEGEVMPQKSFTETVPRLKPGVLEDVIIRGDLSGLKPEDRVTYYKTLCHSLGLNPMTQPFEYLTFQGKLRLYANKGCAEQLRDRDNISIEDVKTEITEDFIRVTAKAKNKNGRTDIALAVVSLIGLKGLERANAEMKCDTKAKRRVTLSICGLGMLDETEVETVKDAVMITQERLDTGEMETVEYRIPFGKHKDKRLQDVSLHMNGEHDDNEASLKGYMRFLREKKDLSDNAKEFLDRADAYLAGSALDREFQQSMDRDRE